MIGTVGSLDKGEERKCQIEKGHESHFMARWLL